MNEQVVLFNYWVDCLAQSATEQGYFLAHSNKDFRLFRQYGAPDVWIPLNVKEDAVLDSSNFDEILEADKILGNPLKIIADHTIRKVIVTDYSKIGIDKGLGFLESLHPLYIIVFSEIKEYGDRFNAHGVEIFNIKKMNKNKHFIHLGDTGYSYLRSENLNWVIKLLLLNKKP